MTEE
jgi:hypothetical protein